MAFDGLGYDEAEPQDILHEVAARLITAAPIDDRLELRTFA